MQLGQSKQGLPGRVDYDRCVGGRKGLVASQGQCDPEPVPGLGVIASFYRPTPGACNFV